MHRVRTAIFSHARLDRCLSLLARQPERFRDGAALLAARLDARGLDLEITPPYTWRRPTKPPRVPVEQQFSVEVGSLCSLEREQELRLALRIEFARLRLARSREQRGPGLEDPGRRATWAAGVCRREEELRALRLEMVERNLYLVLTGVRRYRHVGADRSDMIQSAATSLLRAVDGYDWRRGVLFRTYAIHWLNQGFRSHLYDANRTVRVPGYVQKSVRQVQVALQRLGDPHASVDEIARESGLRPSTIAATRRVERRIWSLDAPLEPGDGARTLGSELALQGGGDPCDPASEGVSIESGVAQALGRLTSRERRVVELRFGIGCARPHLHGEIGALLGVGAERVRQILGRALQRMRGAHLRRILEPLIG